MWKRLLECACSLYLSFSGLYGTRVGDIAKVSDPACTSAELRTTTRGIIITVIRSWSHKKWPRPTLSGSHLPHTIKFIYTGEVSGLHAPNYHPALRWPFTDLILYTPMESSLKKVRSDIFDQENVPIQRRVVGRCLLRIMMCVHGR